MSTCLLDFIKMTITKKKKKKKNFIINQIDMTYEKRNK